MPGIGMGWMDYLMHEQRNQDNNGDGDAEKIQKD
jgi:hypothetical protein